MAPISHLLARSSKTTSRPSSSTHYYGGEIGGGVVGFIILLMVIIFVVVAVFEYSKAKRLRDTRNIPISKSKIFKKALLYAVTIGIASCLCAECCDGGSDDNSGSVAQQPLMNQSAGSTMEMGYVPQPMPSFQPQMDYTPLQSAAQDGVQG